MKILVADSVPDRAIEILKAEPSWEVVNLPKTKGQVTDEIGDADALLVRSATKVTAKLLEQAPQERSLLGPGDSSSWAPVVLHDGLHLLEQGLGDDRLVLTGPELDPGLESEEAFAETLGRYADVGVTDVVVHWPRPSDPYAGDAATFERVVSGVSQ